MGFLLFIILMKLAQGQQVPNLFQQCINPKIKDEVLTLGGIELEQYNLFCGPHKLSSEAINIGRLNRSFIARVVGDLKAFRDLQMNRIPNTKHYSTAASYADYQSDGMCLETETLDQCISRWERARTDADAQLRRDIPAQNAAQLQMVGSKNQLQLGSNGMADNVNGGVLYDFYAQSRDEIRKSGVRAKDIAPEAFQNHGKALFSGEEFKAVKDTDVQDPWLVENLGLSGERPGIEIEGQTADQEFTAKVEKNAAKIQAKYKSDIRESSENMKNAVRADKRFMGKHSWEIFKAMMNSYDQQLTQADPKKYADGLKKPPSSASETLTVRAPITDNAVKREASNNAVSDNPTDRGNVKRRKSTEEEILEGLQNLIKDAD